MRIIHPDTVYIESNVSIAPGVVIEPHVVIKKNVSIKSNSIIKSFSYIENSTIGNNCSIGPYARIRPAVIMADEVKIGNFVEIKKSKLSKGVKVNHLSYIGDSFIGTNSNIGAGTITCNYDGVKKYKTNIKNNVFVGSNTSLVAPVTLEENSVIGAGSVITKRVKAKSLALTRANQQETKNYRRKKK